MAPFLRASNPKIDINRCLLIFSELCPNKSDKTLVISDSDSGQVISKPSDVDGTCPVNTYSFGNQEVCCCGTRCCWIDCTWDQPPSDCLPDNTEWIYNDTLGYYRATRNIITEYNEGKGECLPSLDMISSLFFTGCWYFIRNNAIQDFQNWGKVYKVEFDLMIKKRPTG